MAADSEVTDRLNAVVLGASEEGGAGWAIAQALAARGAHVNVGARRSEGIERLAARIGGTAVVCDAIDEVAVSDFADRARTAGGPIDVAVLAAGAGVSGTIDAIPADDFRKCFELNYVAPVWFVRHMARRMRDGGSIVLISSIAATNPWPGYFAYGSAKAAVQTLVRYAALEYAPRGIRVNAVCPGPIRTAVSAGLLDHPLAGPLMASEIPLGRAVTPEEVAEAVAWLATAPTWITGETVHVDGGLHLRRPPDPAAIQAALANPSKP